MNEFELFQSALDIDDPTARKAYLTSACESDPQMQSRIEALLASHEGQSQFLNTPVVEQIADVADAGIAATMIAGNGSTQDNEREVKIVHSDAADPMTEQQEDSDDGFSLGYLEPSSKPGSLGRLAHYEVLEAIGRGAFGTVLRAFDEKLQRVVAIKVMAPELASTSPARKRFIREAQASAAIRHEHVVSVYAVEEKPLPYLVMEYIPGQTLQQRLDERGPLDVPSVLQLGRQVAEGLAAAHAKDLIHRDIKPGNILLETGVHDRVKITDFGLARAADDASLTQSGTIAGTPMYMAPEQALGHQLDQRADLFSLGSVLYQMVSGRPPFRAPSALAVLKRVAEETPRPIREIIPETPRWLCDIIAKLHAKNPDERYQSAQEVADVLADCEAQLKVNSKLQDFSRIPHGQTTAPQRSRKQAFVLGSVLVLLALVGMWAGPSAARYASNQGVLEIQPGEGLVDVIVLHNDEGVLDGNKLKAPATDWLSMKQRQSLTLPTGRYQLNVGTSPAGTSVGQWEVTVSGLFGSSEVKVPVVQTSAIITVGRGQRVTLRPVMQPVPAAPPTVPTPVEVSKQADPESDGWVSLFNGKDLTGWQPHLDNKAEWRVEDAALTAKGEVGYLATVRADYHDFHLRAEFKINNQGNSGIIFRHTGGHLTDYDQMHNEADIFGGGNCHVFARRGGRELDKWTSRDPIPVQSWLVYEVIAAGGHITVKLDGQVLIDVDEANPIPTSDHIILESLTPGTVVHFRKIEIKELAASEPKATSPRVAIAPFDAAQARAHQEAWARHLGVPVEHTNSIGMKFVLIPPGEFLMGSTPAEIEEALKEVGEDPQWQERIKSEGPRHKCVLTQPIFLGVHEVTQAAYERVMGMNPSHFAPTGEGKAAVAGADTTKYPVEMVSWNDAAEFAARLSTLEKLKPFYLRANDVVTPLEGNGYRLASEAEWEFACRAGNTTRYWTGDKDEELMLAGKFDANSGGSTQSVGLLKANPFGLYDVHGNVWEWVQDGWAPDDYKPFQDTSATDPTRLFAADSQHVLRGGNWSNTSSYCRASIRYASSPTHRDRTFGFRVAMTVDAVKAAAQARLPATHTNSIGMEFVIVPKGKSWLGGGNGRQGRKEVEIPADFYLGKYEVTQEEWEKVMGKNPSRFSRAGNDKEAVKDVSDADLKRFPVEELTWDDCQSFVAKLTQQEANSGWVYRLPTEVEWEYACRNGPMADKADSAFDYYFSKPTNTLLPTQANFKDSGLLRPCRVGSYEPNALGLYDMHGNIHEWCDPVPGTSDRNTNRASRGGTAISVGAHLQAKFHTVSPKAIRYSFVGLRVVRVPTTAAPVVNAPPTGIAPFTEADVQRIAALPAADQVEAVRQELKRLNPKFDGTLKPTIENGVVIGLQFNTDEVDNIAPVRALKGLTSFDCRGTYRDKGKLSDLSPLKGMSLGRLDCSSTQIVDLGPLAGMPLTILHINHNPVSDLKPLAGMPLVDFGCAETQVSDLTPLKDMKLQTLGAQLLPVTDLSPLHGMPLKGLDLYHTLGATNLQPLQGMPLEMLNLQDVPVSDLSPLAGMTSLKSLALAGNAVTDLTPLKGLKLTELFVRERLVSDLSPLKDVPLTKLCIDGSGATDLRPLQDMPLVEIRLTPKSITQGLEILRGKQSLKTIGIGDKSWPAVEFWARYDKGEFKE